MKRSLVFGLLGMFAAVASGCDMGPAGINGSVTVTAGEKAGSVSRVNGSIRIEEGASADHANTVNGSIRFAARATGGGANTVNGSISLDEGAKVSGSINTVNGSLKLASGAEVAGSATNVNGDIRLDHAHIGGDIATVNADIDIGTDSVVDGGITVKKPGGISFGKEVPRIVIGPGATVKGTMKFERDVKLYVSDTATIGAVEGATAEKFSGSDAPK